MSKRRFVTRMERFRLKEAKEDLRIIKWRMRELIDGYETRLAGEPSNWPFLSQIVLIHNEVESILKTTKSGCFTVDHRKK